MNDKNINKYGSFGKVYKIKRIKDSAFFAVKKIEKAYKRFNANDILNHEWIIEYSSCFN